MPRVTEILDYLTEPELVNWMLRTSEKKRKQIQDEALRVGSSVDLLVQQDIKDGGYLVPDGDTPIENCMKGWEKFKADYPLFVPSVLEMQTELRDGDLIGHPDFIRSVDQWWNITDLKCASGIRPKYWTQVAEYSTMKMKMAGWCFPCSLSVLRLDKTYEDGKYEYVEISDITFIEYEMQVFQAYLTAFNHAMKTREQLRQQLEEAI